MKSPNYLLAALTVAFVVIGGHLPPVPAAEEKPDILVIMADDVGWASLGSYHQGLKCIKTPNIDILASEGMRFTDYYAQLSCTVGNAAFLTGQYPVRTCLHTPRPEGDPIGLNADDPTIADLLKPLGYVKGKSRVNHFGDLDEFLPTSHGFDEFWGCFIIKTRWKIQDILTGLNQRNLPRNLGRATSFTHLGQMSMT